MIDPSDPPTGALRPSWFYRTDLWRLGHWSAQHFPRRFAVGLSGLLATVYWRCNRRRRETVIRNLLPVLGGHRSDAEAAARELFHQFALKLIDLWRYESGLPVDHLISDLRGWDHFLAAQKRSGGILLLTVHLGNWELGAPLLAAHGVKLTVISLVEPHAKLTELRQQSRLRWGIETLIIGENPFAFVDVIRRLDAGGAVALLVDRPPAASGTTGELFGRPFQASISAAELARASGCTLLPVFIVRTPSGYHAEVLPEVAYDRAALGSRDARQKLTGQIMRVFESTIRQYPSQWYHFVNIWPEE